MLDIAHPSHVVTHTDRHAKSHGSTSGTVPADYSPVQKWLHWAVAGLILLRYMTFDGMGRPFSEGVESGAMPYTVALHMMNTGEIATAQVATPHGRASYAGTTAIDGVPGSHAGVRLMLQNLAGSICGALLPTGRAVDVVESVEATLIDNGMPCVDQVLPNWSARKLAKACQLSWSARSW